MNIFNKEATFWLNCKLCHEQMVKGSNSLQPLRRGRRHLRLVHIELHIGQDQKRGGATFTQDLTSGLSSL